MDDSFTAALGRATAHVRAQDVAGATRIIQQALGLRRAPEARRAPEDGVIPPAGGPRAPARRRPRLDPDAEVIEAAPADAPGTSEAPRTSRARAGADRLRRPLGEMLALLREGRGRLGRMPVGGGQQAPAVPEGARYEWRSLAVEAGGRRDYRLYVPSGAAAGVRGLVVMLHGCSQNPDDFAVGTAMNAVAERERLIVAYPRQGRSENAMSCWNWFNPGDQRRDAGEPGQIAAITRALLAEFEVDAGRSMVAGLSAGGAMAAVLGATYPEVFAAVGVHSGLAYGSANDVASAFAAMRGDAGAAAGRPAATRTIVFHGTADTVVHPGNAERILGARRGRREHGTSPGGRAWSREVVAAADGRAGAELWLVQGAGHAWSGGAAAGSYTDPAGPDASAEMVRFFLEGR